MISERRRRVCPFIHSHVSSTTQKLKLNIILEIYSTTQFNFTACLSIPELQLYFLYSHQATDWKSRNCVSIPDRDKRLFSSSKHFADSGFLFSAYWKFLPRGHSLRYSAEIKNNRSSSSLISRRTEVQICLYPTSQYVIYNLHETKTEFFPRKRLTWKKMHMKIRVYTRLASKHCPAFFEQPTPFPHVPFFIAPSPHTSAICLWILRQTNIFRV